MQIKHKNHSIFALNGWTWMPQWYCCRDAAPKMPGFCARSLLELDCEVQCVLPKALPLQHKPDRCDTSTQSGVIKKKCTPAS